jgi:uncharacterized protein
MDEHRNVAAYRRAVEAFRANDLVALETLIADDVVWHVPGSGPRAGDIIGRESLLRWLAGLSDLGFWLREHDVIGNDRHVCALSYMGARRPGVDVEMRVVSIFHYSDGQQAERWFYPDDLDVWDIILGADPTP